MWAHRDSRSASQPPRGFARPFRHQAGLLEDRRWTARSCSRPKSSRSSRRRSGEPRGNHPLIAAYLRGSRYPTLEETFFDGIRSVPPATWCEIDLAAPAAPRFQSYWNLADYTASHNTLTYEEAVARVEATAGGRGRLAPPGRREGRRAALGRPRFIDPGRAGASRRCSKTADLFARLPRCRAGVLRNALCRCHDTARRDREP